MIIKYTVVIHLNKMKTISLLLTLGVIFGAKAAEWENPGQGENPVYRIIEKACTFG